MKKTIIEAINELRLGAEASDFLDTYNSTNDMDEYIDDTIREYADGKADHVYYSDAIDALREVSEWHIDEALRECPPKSFSELIRAIEYAEANETAEHIYEDRASLNAAIALRYYGEQEGTDEIDERIADKITNDTAIEKAERLFEITDAVDEIRKQRDRVSVRPGFHEWLIVIDDETIDAGDGVADWAEPSEKITERTCEVFAETWADAMTDDSEPTDTDRANAEEEAEDWETLSEEEKDERAKQKAEERADLASELRDEIAEKIEAAMWAAYGEE